MKKLFLFIGLGFLLQACAREMIPNGGPQDTAPPKIIRELPGNRSTSFHDPNIRIFFDEYVTLNNPNTNIIFSPPLSTLPTYTLSGRSLIIQFNDELMPDKTYNVAFTNAIKDYNEGNLLPFYQYTFSTGTSIDSFMIDGFLYNAETLEPEKDVYILLYEDDIDSLPYSVSPTYITRSQQNGYFTFRHITSGDYKIFALHDINNNLRYDLPNESIAFMDTMIQAYVIPVEDTSNGEMDSVDGAPSPVDSLRLKSPLNLWLFTPTDTVQRMEKPVTVRPGVYRITFKLPFSDISTRFLRPDTLLPYMESISHTRDTVTWFFKSKITDTVTLELTVDGRSPDTVNFLPGRFQQQQRGRGARKAEPEKLTIRTINGGELYKPYMLTFSYPVLPVDSFAVTIIQNRRSGNDTVVRYYVVPDTFVTSLPLIFPLEERVPYIIKIRDSVFYGYDGSTHDSLTFRFTSKSEKDYGNLTLHIELGEMPGPYIVQLISSDNKVVRTDLITSNSTMTYMYLQPGSYRIRLIEDRNGNGKWDTGNYGNKIQPEKVIFPQKTFTVRGYWDMEETLDLNEQEVRTGNRR